MLLSDINSLYKLIDNDKKSKHLIKLYNVLTKVSHDVQDFKNVCIENSILKLNML